MSRYVYLGAALALTIVVVVGALFGDNGGYWSEAPDYGNSLRSKTGPASGRFQFVWWGIRCWRWPRRHRWVGGLDRIYAWSFVVGPLEVRRWRHPAGSTGGTDNGRA